MAVTAAQLQQLYLAYFGRPADFDGIVYYTTGNWDIWQVAQAFGESPESQRLYGPGFNASVVNAIYNNLFNRDAEPAGLLYWSQEVASGRLTAGEAALGILLGAQNADATTVANKLTVAAAFTAELDTAQEILAYTGDAAAAAARAFLATVTSDAASVTAATANMDAVIADIVDVGGITGVTVGLTTDPDTFASANQTYIDTVNGIINDDGTYHLSTFSDSDKITGNGHTVVNVTVKDATFTPFVTMSDIAKLSVVNAGGTGAAATFDASSWTNVSQIAVSGGDSLYLQIDDLTNEGPIKLKFDAATSGTIEIVSTNAAAVGNAALYGTLYNDDADTVGAIAAFGTTGVDVILGASDTADFAYSQSKAAAATGVATSVGSLNVAHVFIEAGKSADADTISLFNYAQATKANATVGSVSLGNISVSVATSADAYLFVENRANATSAAKGSGTAGDITIFWTNITASASADATVSIYNSATSHKGGSATVGNVALGGLSMTGTGDIDYYVSNNANAVTSGAAKAGNITIGNISIHAASATDSHTATIYNYAFADKGAATVGNITVGNVDMTGGYYNYLSISNWASNTKTGAVTAGTVTIGNINMVATGTGTNYISVYNSAIAWDSSNIYKGGASTVGDIVIGTINMTVATSSNTISIYSFGQNRGFGGGAATVGNLTIGTVTMNQAAADSGGDNELYVSASASSSAGSATIGNLTIGDVNINAAGITQVDSYNQVSVYRYADAGSSGLATVGTLTVGNITAKTGVNGETYIQLSQQASASGASGGSTGRVTVGNVTMTGSKGASMYMYAYNYATGTGATVGGVTVGNVSIKGDTSAGTVDFSVNNSATSGDASNVSIGNVTLQAKNVGFYVSNSASSDGVAGGLVVGNVSLKGGDYGGQNSIWQYGQDSAAALTVGTVTLTSVKGNGTTAESLNLNISNSSTGGAVGTLTVGAIAMTLASGNTTNTNSTMNLDIYTDSGKASGGNIVTGNITIGTSGMTTAATLAAGAIAADVNITSTDGTVTVGNITVTGGVKGGGGTGALTDNLNVLTTWLNLSGSTVTVGNVDYSGYTAASTINVSTYAGVGTIKASKGGSAITDNKAANSIDLSANTTKADTINFVAAQSGVKDSGGVVTASQTGLDVISGWAAGDKLTVVGGIGGDADFIQNTPSQTYAQFLLNAEAQLTVAGNAGYVAVIDGNTYLALNVAGKVGQIVQITGSHTFSFDNTTDTVTFLT